MATVNQQDYYQGALGLLAKDGFGALRLTTLCRWLGMSTGSFYNWFRDWNDFVDQFLAYWERELTEQLATRAARTPDPTARLDRLRELARVVPHDAEVALRAWGNCDQRAARVCHEVDDLRRRLIFDAVHGLVEDPVLANRLAALGLSIVIGHQHLDAAEMDWSLRQFNALVGLHADGE